MYQFYKGDLPDQFDVDFPVTLFNDKKHRLFQSPGTWISFYILSLDENKAKAGVHFCITDGVARSPHRSPYGGIDFNAALEPTLLSNFVNYMEGELRQLDVSNIELKLADVVSERYDLVEQIVTEHRYKLEKAEVAAKLLVGPFFESSLHYSEKKRLRKLLRHEFFAENIELANLEKVYRFINQCRIEKGYVLSMSWAEVEALARTYPEKIFLFIVRKDSTWVAASICVQVDPSTMYDFYHDHDSSYNSFSPVVLLVKEMHDFFLKRSIKWIDLGTSMVGNHINTGLQNFKLHLGAVAQRRCTFSKWLYE